LWAENETRLRAIVTADNPGWTIDWIIAPQPAHKPTAEAK